MIFLLHNCRQSISCSVTVIQKSLLWRSHLKLIYCRLHYNQWDQAHFVEIVSKLVNTWQRWPSSKWECNISMLKTQRKQYLNWKRGIPTTFRKKKLIKFDFCAIKNWGGDLNDLVLVNTIDEKLKHFCLI